MVSTEPVWGSSPTPRRDRQKRPPCCRPLLLQAPEDVVKDETLAVNVSVELCKSYARNPIRGFQEVPSSFEIKAQEEASEAEAWRLWLEEEERKILNDRAQRVQRLWRGWRCDAAA